MSDNPGNEAPELISLGVDVDSGSFGALNSAVDALNSRIDSLIETAARLALTGDESAASFLEQLQGIGRASLDSEQAVSNLSKQVDQLAAEYDKVAQAANQAAEAMSTAGSDYNKGEYINEAARGYGVSGGMIGPGQSGEDDGGSGGGSLFGVAHAASVAGHALGAPALREAGAFLYIEEGLKRVGPLFEDLNASLEASGGLIPPLTTAFEGLGVPMAGLVASAIPAAVGVAAVGVAFLVLKSQLDEGKDAIDQAISQLGKYYAAIGSGKTSNDLQSDLDKAKTKLANDQTQFKQVSDQMLSGISQATEGQGIGAVPGMIKLLLSGGFQDLEASADKLKVALKDDQANVDALTAAIGSQDTANADYLKTVHDAVEASKAQAEEEAKIADLRESGTAKQVQAEMDRIDHQVEANHKQLEILKLLDQTNPDVIAAENKIIDDNAALSLSYGELSGDVLDLAKARDAEADAIKEQLAQMKKVEKAEADYNQAREKAITDLAAQDEAAKQHEATAERQYAQGSLEDTEARRQIALKESREETKLKENTANRITDIGAKLGEKQYADVLNLSRQLYDDQIKYQESAAKYEREAQYQAESDKQDHLARLAELQQQANDSEFDDILKRDFLKLFQDQRKQGQDTQKEDNSYRQREDKLRDHLKQQENELAISTQQEEARQKLATQRKLEDDQRAASAEVVQAVIAANRKLEVLRNAEIQQFNDLNAMESYKIKLLHQGLTDELKLYAQQEQAKLALLAHTRDLILAQNPLGLLPQGASRTGSDLTAQPYQSGPSSRTQTAIFDSGGSFGGGDMWSKGSLAEDVRFASGRGYNLGGSAIVYPLESGTVKPGGGKTISVNAPITIYDAQDTNKTALVIRQQLTAMIKEFIGDSNG